MSRITQQKGDIATAEAISFFTKLHQDVSIPLTESAPYDLIVDDNGNLKKVQVKYTSGKFVDMRRIHSNAQGYVVNKYNATDFDWLFVHNPKIGNKLLKEIPMQQNYITIF